MRDVVVTVPLSFGLERWIAEGDAAGEPWSGIEWDFHLSGRPPDMQPGDRVYVVHNGKLRGYSPLLRIQRYEGRRYALVRGGDAVAVTIDQVIPGFRGFRYRWWERTTERPFSEWRTP